MAKNDTTDSGAPAAVYVGWGTFKNSIIDGMVEGLPNVIDKSIFVGMAGGVQSHMMAGLKFLGLINDAGQPTEALRKLTVDDEAARKKALAAILKERYAALISIGLDKASMKQLLDTLEASYRVTGDTKEKAARFFIAAAQYAGIPLSRHIMEGGISAGRKRPAAKRGSDSHQSQSTDQKNGGAGPTVGETRTVKLGNGTLTLSASVSFMKLDKHDREFVFGLVDQLDEYETANPPSDEQD